MQNKHINLLEQMVKSNAANQKRIIDDFRMKLKMQRLLINQVKSANLIVKPSIKAI